MGLVYINGEFVPTEEAKISVFDRGLLYGDGVFEGIRAYNGSIFKLNEHLERLYASAQAIWLKIPLSFDEMKKAVIETVRVNNLKDCYIRLIVTRGSLGLGIDPWEVDNPTVIIIADKIRVFPKELYEKGLTAVTVATRRSPTDVLDPRIKSLNYLHNILARIEARLAGAAEGIMLNHQGYVTEATVDNVFIVHKGTLYTPTVTIGVLPGITRAVVIELATKYLELPVKEALLTRYDLYNAEEVFLTGTAVEIVPVVKIDGRIIGDGKPGKITKELRRIFYEYTRQENVGSPVYVNE
ncbi:MAG: branched-chain-amino-acid transaminase [Dictyoglomaceae bacterium]